MKPDKRMLLIAGVLFLIIGMAVLILLGPSYTLRLRMHSEGLAAEDIHISIEQDREIIRIAQKRLEGRELSLEIRPVSEGRAFIQVVGPHEFDSFFESVYVHRFGILTVGGYLGNASGAKVIPVLVSFYLVLCLWYVTARFREETRKSLYQYQNIRYLGWIIFLVLMLLGQVPYLTAGNSLVQVVKQTLNSASGAALIAFPVAFLVSVGVAVSNLRLMQKEGRNWRNMLGMFLGLLVCLGTVFPVLLSEFLQRTTLVDVHNERGVALYVEMAVTNGILIAVSYLECILWSTVILARRAARQIPSFDRDYMLILGCQLRADGTLTPLLKGRADRALDFARLQKEAAGKDLVFVPSGGKGADEAVAEAQAIREYLVSAGVPEARILTEDRSGNTEENFKFSLALIREHSPAPEPNIAFSTTNYHVFRSGILARQQGIHAQGIGSGTRSYFWINAFVREFAATLQAGWKKHLRVIAALILLTLAMVWIVRLSNTL